jgi:hypothetical protein
MINDKMDRSRKLGEIVLNRNTKKEVYSIDNKILIETKDDSFDSNRLIIIGEYNLDKKDIIFNNNLNKYAKKHNVDKKKLSDKIITTYFLDKLNYN